MRPLRELHGKKRLILQKKEEFVTRDYGAIIVATGYRPISLENFEEFGYAQNKDVITSLELERLMNAAGPTKGVLLRPSDNTHRKRSYSCSVWVRRDISGCGKPYCSKICCMYTAKHAMLIPRQVSGYERPCLLHRRQNAR